MRSTPSPPTIDWSEAKPLTETGRLWGTSASSAPSVITMRTPSSCALATTASVNLRQRSEGSVPSSTTRSPSAPGTSAPKNSLAGQSISRVRPSVRRTLGLTAVKS